MFLREPSHLIIVAVVLLVLFGGRRLPDTARGIGRSLRIFKSEIRETNQDDEAPCPDREAARQEALEGMTSSNGQDNGADRQAFSRTSPGGSGLDA